MPHPALNLCVHMAEPSLAAGAARWIFCPRPATISAAFGCDQGLNKYMRVVFTKSAMIRVKGPDTFKIKVDSIFTFFADISIHKRAPQVWTGMFYMGRFGGASPKRHRLWSNDRSLIQDICDRAGYMSRADQASCTARTTRKYTDKNGVKRCVGIKDALRESQQLANSFWSDHGCKILKQIIKSLVKSNISNSPPIFVHGYEISTNVLRN